MLKRFKCTTCPTVDLRAGGTSGYQCAACYPRSPARELQLAAHKAVADAVRLKRLPHPSTLMCADCAGHAQQYDHRDYNAPLVVAPVCRRCNVRRGPAVGSPAFKGHGAPSAPSPAIPQAEAHPQG